MAGVRDLSDEFRAAVARAAEEAGVDQASLDALRDAHVAAVRERADPFPPAAAEVARSLAHLAALVAPSRAARLAGSASGASLERDAATRARVCSTAVERLQQAVDGTSKRCEEARKKSRGGVGPRWWADGLLAGTGFAVDPASGAWGWGRASGKGGWGGIWAGRGGAGAKGGGGGAAPSPGGACLPRFPYSPADLLAMERRLASEAASAPSPAEVAHRQGAVLALSEGLADATAALDAFRAERERARRAAEEAARRRRPKAAVRTAGGRRGALGATGRGEGAQGEGADGGERAQGEGAGGGGASLGEASFPAASPVPPSVLSSRRGAAASPRHPMGGALPPGTVAFASAVAPEGSGGVTAGGMAAGGMAAGGMAAAGMATGGGFAGPGGGGRAVSARERGRAGGGGGPGAGPSGELAGAASSALRSSPGAASAHQQQLQAFLASSQRSATSSALRQQAAQAAQAAHEISQLNAIFSAAVARQGAQIATLYDEALAATGHVDRATAQLEKADKVGKGGTLTSFYFLILCSLLVLLAHFLDG